MLQQLGGTRLSITGVDFLPKMGIPFKNKIRGNSEKKNPGKKKDGEDELPTKKWQDAVVQCRGVIRRGII